MLERKWWIAIPVVLLGGAAIVVGLVPGARNWVDQTFPQLGINGPTVTNAVAEHNANKPVAAYETDAAEIKPTLNVDATLPLESENGAPETLPVYQQPTQVQYAGGAIPVQNQSNPERFAQTQLPSVPTSGLNVPSSSPKGTLVVRNAQIIFPEDIQVAAKSDGMITELHVDDGSVVKAGDPIIIIDPSMAEAEAEVAKQQLLAAEIKAKDVSNVEYAIAAERVAEVDLEISNRLVLKGSEGDMDNRKKRLEHTKAELQIGVAKSEKAQQAAEVRVNEAKLSAANVQLTWRKIPAYFDGVVSDVKKRKFAFVRTGDVILRLTSMETVRVKGNAYTDVAPNLLLNAPARVTIAVPGMQENPVVNGVVTYVSPRADAENLYPIQVKIQNQKTSDGQFLFREGMIATIEIMHGVK